MCGVLKSNDEDEKVNHNAPKLCITELAGYQQFLSVIIIFLKNKKEGSDRSQINTLIELDSSVTRNVMTGEFADDLEGAVSVWKSTAGLPGNKNSKPVRVHLLAAVIIEHVHAHSCYV